MDCRREGIDDKTGERFTPSKRRACLFISLIVLVWNVAATGHHMLSAARIDASPSDMEPAILAAPAMKSGPLTARQEFLLGKRVDINRASYDEINGLPGISDAVAKEVIDTRRKRGVFRRPGDLLAIPGIKEKRLKKILPFLSGFHNN